VGSIPAVRTIMLSDKHLLHADELHLWRGDLHLLRGLSFSLDAGSCLQVTGINGAGKTSLLRALAGLLHFESGTVHWRGLDTRKDTYPYHSELAWLSHGTALKADLSAHENLRFSAGLRRALTGTDIDAALAQVGYTQSDRLLARQMSAGQQRRVALARVLLLACPLWLLDEPTSNLDSRGQEMFGQMLTEHVRSGGVAIIATHQVLPIPEDRLQSLELS
jgi:heme exporter protein A